MTRAAALSLVLIPLVTACAGPRPVDGPRPEDQVPITTVSPVALSHYLAARTHADRFHHAKALEEYQAAVKLDPEFAVAWLDMAWVAGSRAEGEKMRARAVSLAGKVTPAEQLRIRAAEAEQQGDTKAAQDLYGQIVDMYPKDGRIRHQLGMSYWMTDDPRGLSHMEAAVRLDPWLDIAWNMLGYAYTMFGRMDDAMHAHRSYVELLPEEPNAHDSYAETLLKAGRHADSIAQYETAIALDPSFVWSRMGIGHNLVFLGHYDEARAAYEQALADSKTPQNRLQAEEWLMVLAVYAGDPDEALRASRRCLDRAAAIGPMEAAGAVRNVARMEAFLGRYDAAERTAGAAESRLPADAAPRMRREIRQSVLRLLAEIAADRRRAAVARRHLGELRGLSDEGAPPWEVQLVSFVEGYVLMSEGKALEAISAFERASKSDPRVLYWHGRAREAAGQRAEARALYEMVAKWNAASLGHALVFADARLRISE